MAIAPAAIWFYANLVLLNLPVNNWATQVIVAISVTLNLGSTFASLIGLEPKRTAIRTLLATAFGLTLIMLFALLLSLTGPLLGALRPLDTGIVKPATLILLGFTTLIVLVFEKDAFEWLVGSIIPAEVNGIILLIPLPFLAAIGAFQLNEGDTNAISLYAMVLISTTLIGCCIYVLLKSKHLNRNPLVINLVSSCTLALFWSTSLRGEGLFGWDIQKEYAVASQTIGRGIFSLPETEDAYGAMASLTALPAFMHSLTGMAAIDILRWLFPLALTVACAGIIATIGELYGDASAIVSFTLLVIATSALARQFPAIGRQEIALMLFAGCICLIAGRMDSVKARQVGLVVLGAGLSFTHYTTAYVTAFLLLVALVIRYSFNFRIRSRKDYTITAPVVGLIIVFIFGWNGIITRPATELQEAADTISSNGLLILDNRQENPIVSWIYGPAARQVPVVEYEKALIESRPKTMAWLNYDRGADSLALKDSFPTVNKGPLEKLSGVWAGIFTLFGQLMIAAVVSLVLVALVSMWRRKNFVRLEVFALAAGAVLFAASLRLSSSLASMYNPERAAVQAGFIFAFVVAAGIHFVTSGSGKAVSNLSNGSQKKISSEIRTLTRKYVGMVVLVGWSFVNVTATLGLQPLIFRGNLHASYSNEGEDVERFRTSSTELATAGWLDANFDSGTLVYADRYGQLVLMSVKSPNGFRFIAEGNPKAVDIGGLVYASRTNIVSKRARGCVARQCATWQFPREFYESTRPIIFATEETRVYGRTN